MIVSTEQKQAALVDALFEKTASGEMHWMETSIVGTFSTVLSGYIVHIEFEEEVFGEQAAATVAILNRDGERIDVFSENDLKNQKPSVKPYTDYYHLLADLYKRASRDASGAEKVLDSLLNILGVVVKPKPAGWKSDTDDEIPF